MPGVRHRIETVVSLAFLALVVGAFGWFFASTLWACLTGVCSDNDGSAIGGVLGLVLLLGVPALLRRMRRR